MINIHHTFGPFKAAIEIACMMLFIAGCDVYDFPGMIWAESPTVNERVAESLAFNDRYDVQVIDSDSEDYRVFVATDAHVDADGSWALKKFAEQWRAEGMPLMLYLGDMIRTKGSMSVFMDQIAPPTSSALAPFHSTAGNHDLYFGQWSEWKSIFNTSTYYFYVRTPMGRMDLYICLDSGSGTIGSLQRDWLEKVLKANAAHCRHVIVFTHTHFFKKDGSQGHTSNYTLEETYDLTSLFASYGVELVLTGHDHYREDTMFKGVRYLIIDALEVDAGSSGPGDSSLVPWYTVLNVGSSSIEPILVKVQ